MADNIFKNMTNEEAIEYNKNLRMYMKLSDKNQPCKFLDENYTALDMAIKALEEQERCETIKEIPKDYKYDTETKDFLVYRHMYTGHEIHIEKPVPRYRLEQEPCEDAISRADAKKYLSAPDANGDRVIYESDLDLLPPVTPQTKMGRWVYEGEGSGYKKWHCSNCKMLVRNPEKPWYSFCPNCGQPKMQEVEE